MVNLSLTIGVVSAPGNASFPFGLQSVATYLTRDDHFVIVTKGDHGKCVVFPQVINDLIRGKVKNHWKNVSWGVGNKQSDAEAYGAVEIPTILIAPRDVDPAEAPETVHVVKDWAEAAKLLLGE